MDDVPKDRQMIPAAIDHRAQASPGRVFAFLPHGDELKDGFYPLTYSAFAKAINAAAWWLDGVLGGPVTDDSAPTIPYIGTNDFRYVLLFVALMKTRRKIMLPLPANTAEGLVRLLDAEQCTVVLSSTESQNIWAPSLEQKPDVKLITVPDLAHFIHDGPVELYSYDRTVDEGLDDCYLVIQTSGTTGNPKPIRHFVRTAFSTTVADTLINKRSPPDMKLAMNELIADCYLPNLLPISWMAGLAQVALWALFVGGIPIVLPASMPQPMTAQYVDEVIKHTPKGKKNGIMFVPDVLRRLARHPEYLQGLKQYDWISYAGAPLDHPTGDFIREKTGVRLAAFNGSTDTSLYPLLLNDPVDWKIHRFHPDSGGFYLSPFTDELHELRVKKQPSDGRFCFANNPDCDDYGTRDLFTKVPGRAGYWTNAGRVDDFVKLATLTKFNAVNIEQIIDRSPHIEKSLVGGDSRDYPFAIIEVTNSILQSGRTPEEIIDLIWPAFEGANEHIFDEAKLTKKLCILADPDLPIKRTAKGTVDRRTTIAVYEQKIEKLYEKTGVNGSM